MGKRIARCCSICFVFCNFVVVSRLLLIYGYGIRCVCVSAPVTLRVSEKVGARADECMRESTINKLGARRDFIHALLYQKRKH